MIASADPPVSRWPHRATVIALCFAATFLCYIDRVNISVAIIPMAKQYGWDKTLQGTVMSAFFIGYLLTQIAGGWLADRFGGKPVLAGGVVIWSLFTALTPPAAAGGFTALLVARIGMGIGEGVSFPSIYKRLDRRGHRLLGARLPGRRRREDLRAALLSRLREGREDLRLKRTRPRGPRV
jgi:ACS family sodium-dependent inorganic phosphate cotransporter